MRIAFIFLINTPLSFKAQKWDELPRSLPCSYQQLSRCQPWGSLASVLVLHQEDLINLVDLQVINFATIAKSAIPIAKIGTVVLSLVVIVV